jgi:anti-anti-sigma regulatory factor
MRSMRLQQKIHRVITFAARPRSNFGVGTQTHGAHMSLQRHSNESQTERISLPARFDRSTTLDMRIPFIRLLASRHANPVRVDLSRVEHIDHFGIGTLMAWDKACRIDGKALVLESCGTHIERQFKRVGVHRAFNYSAVVAA